MSLSFFTLMEARKEVSELLCNQLDKDGEERPVLIFIQKSKRRRDEILGDRAGGRRVGLGAHQITSVFRRWPIYSGRRPFRSEVGITN